LRQGKAGVKARRSRVNGNLGGVKRELKRGNLGEGELKQGKAAVKAW